MRYDASFGRGYDRGWGRGWQGAPPRYDEMFRGRERHAEGPPNWRRGRDAGRMGWRDVPAAFGPGTHASGYEHPLPGETDFLGRPYPRQALEDRPWGLMEQDRMQARAFGYDAGYRGYDQGFRGGPRGAYGGRPRYDVEYDVRPEDYHPRFIPDSDDYGRGREMRYTSNWTRWF